MTTPFTRAAQVAAIALIVTVVTQLTYVTLGNLGIEPNRQLIWSLEVLAYLAVAIAGFSMLPANPLVGGAVATGGVLNTVQAGMGLVMFAPLAGSGAVFSAVLAMAFLLYFAGKLAFALAAIAAGLDLQRGGNGAARWVGVVALLAGLLALVCNTLAIALEADLTQLAGGSGTLAALLLALVLVPAVRGAEPEEA